ncbi:MAG: efflux RND transporter periplasmic adaptor subunit, partial [Burkholderiaceae bacterium]
LEVARANLERTKPLAKLNALSQQDLDNANGQFLTSKANVDQAQANLDSANLNLSYATITSPITGVTGNAIVTDGTFVSTNNSQLTTVAVLSPMWVNFSLSEAQALGYRRDIESGALRRPADDNYTVEVLLADGTVFPYKGRITFSDPSFNAQTGTFSVRAQLENPQGVLRPNQFVRVRLVGAIRPNAQAVPKRAVQQGPKGHFVWLVGKDSKAELRPVIVGPWVGEDWIITAGLDPTSVVVVDGAVLLSEGLVVKSQALAAPAAVATAAVATQRPASADPARPPSVQLPAHIFFASGSAVLDSNAAMIVRGIANGLVGTPDAVEITGYADASGTSPKNQALAKQRAAAVRDALVVAGVSSARLRLAAPGSFIGGADPAHARRVELAFATR